MKMYDHCCVQDRPEEYERARGKFIIDKDIMEILPKKSIVMHPLPRVDEVKQCSGNRSCSQAPGPARFQL